MKKDLASSSVSEQFDFLMEYIVSDKFLKASELKHEIPYFICPYNHENYSDVSSMIDKLLIQLENKGKKVCNINLYDICLSILKDDDDLNWYINNESNFDKNALRDEFRGVFDIENILIPRIVSIINDHEMIFVSGIGEVYPYIRIHNILNNLQSKTGNIPVLIFYPGKYEFSPEKGASLVLFNRLKNDRYYRAFNIFEESI